MASTIVVTPLVRKKLVVLLQVATAGGMQMATTFVVKLW